jgi:heavy metal sensor kinase
VRAWFRQTGVRLALAYSGIFSLVALVAAGAVWLTITSVEYSGIDDSLAAEAKALQPAVASDTGHALSGLSAPGDVSGTAGVGIAALLFDRDANLIDRTAQGPPAADLIPVVRAVSSGSPVLSTVRVDGIPQRIRASLVQAQAGQTEVLVVVRSMAQADQIISITASVLLVGMAVLMVAATVIGYGLARTALRPVREMTAAARAFSEHDLHRRIELDLPADELGDLADTFNQMLARLETAFDSLRRFTADAAHELRAPLALIRTEAEVTLKRPRSAAQYQASLGTILSESERLGRMADQLLMLARAEAGALAPQVSDVELAQLVADTVRLWLPLAAEQEVALIADGPDQGSVRGDRDLLRRLLDNLIDNAIRHSPPRARVLVSAKRVGRNWELVVADSGPGVPEVARGSIFDRFSRADQARARETGGAGLGLALCKAIAELHHGSISLEEQPGGGARFVVRLTGAAPGT